MLMRFLMACMKLSPALKISLGIAALFVAGCNRDSPIEPTISQDAIQCATFGNPSRDCGEENLFCKYTEWGKCGADHPGGVCTIKPE